MALNTALFNTDQVAARNIELKAGIEEMLDKYSFDQYKSQFQALITELETKETKLLEDLGYTKGTVKERVKAMSDRIRNAENRLPKFSNKELGISLIYHLEDQSSKVSGLISQRMGKILEDQLAVSLTNGTTAAQVLLNFLNDAKGMERTGRNKIRAPQAFNIQNADQFFYKKLTTVQKQVVIEYLQKYDNDWWKANFDMRYAKPVLRSSKNNDQINMTATYTSFSDIVNNGLTKEEAEAMPQKERDRINQALTDQIVAMAESNQQAMIRLIINDLILKENPYIFFVGKGIQQITGILGEIQSIYYLNEILMGDMCNEKLSPKLQWRGGTTSESSKKPHADVVFEDFGIQVKNTTKDFVHQTEQGVAGKLENISFTSLKIDSFLELLNNLGLQLSPMEVEIIKSAYGTYRFNVPYKRVKTKGLTTYVSASATSSVPAHLQRFLDVREELRATISLLDKLFALFTNTLMYLDAGPQLTDSLDTSRNVLFMLGGQTITTASIIMTNVMEALDKNIIPSLHITSSFGTTKGWTIIDSLNQVDKGHKFLKHHDGQAEFEKTVNSITLTSAYTFDNLL